MIALPLFMLQETGRWGEKIFKIDQYSGYWFAIKWQIIAARYVLTLGFSLHTT